MPGRPRIALDATVVRARPTGAGRFVRNLAAALPRVDDDCEYVALVTPEGEEALAGQIETRRVPAVHGLRWELRAASLAARAARADLVFSARELLLSRKPPVALHVFEPPAYRLRAAGVSRVAAKDAVLTAILPFSLRTASVVTAGSETTAAWLRRRLRVDPAAVILPGVEDVFYDPVEPPERDPYLLHFVTGDGRERTDVVLGALRLLGADAPRLLLAGSRGAEAAAEAAALGVGDRVEALGWVADDELRRLYRGAVAFLHPTRYEGYGGYPALEAMAVGAPVIGLRAPGATEALEGAAELLDRPDPRLLADAVLRLARDAARREELVAAGRRRVENLRWEQIARAFARVLGAQAATRSTAAASRSQT